MRQLVQRKVLWLYVHTWSQLDCLLVSLGPVIVKWWLGHHTGEATMRQADCSLHPPVPSISTSGSVLYITAKSDEIPTSLHLQTYCPCSLPSISLL